MGIAVVSARTAGQVVLVRPTSKLSMHLIVFLQFLNPKEPEPLLPYELHEHVSINCTHSLLS
jgi:hypothetical protein